MKKSVKQVTIVKMLENFFGGEPLLKENRKLFVELDTKKAGDLFDYMEEYLNQHQDFLIPQRTKPISRPFLWHQTAKSSSEVGGDVFNYEHTISAADKISNLKNLLLLHHQVMITDQLHFNLSVLSDNANNTTHKPRYDDYIDFLIGNKLFIDNNILIICSDRTAFETAPVVEELDKFDDHEVTAFVRKQLLSEYSELDSDDISRMLAYMLLTDKLNADEFIDTQYYLDVYRSIYAFWEKAVDYKQPSSVTFKESLNISAEKLPNQEIVNIRLNDEAFNTWLNDFSSALELSDPEEFRDRMQEGIIRLQTKAPSILEGIPKSIIFGLFSGAITLPFGPIVAIFVGTGVSTAIEILDRSIRRKAELNKSAAKEATVLHYTALLRSKS